MRLPLLTVVLLSASAPAAPPPPPPPDLVRVAVIDTSGSMEGERLAAVKADLAALTKDLPPSSAHPVVLIPFHQEVGEVRTFTERGPFDQFVARLKAEGGTSIASGLSAAVKELQAHAGARHLCVLLYTDGEDKDAAAIRVQEERLDGLFADRSQKGLAQTVVFAKRWESANEELLNRIRGRGNARVVDAGEHKVISVTLRPAVTVAAVRWAAEPDAVEVDLVAALRADGLPPGALLPPPPFGLRSPTIRGDTTVRVPPRGTAPLRLRMPVTADMVRAKAVELEFVVGQPVEAHTPAGLILPTMATDRVKVAVALPAWHPRTRLSAAPAAEQAAKWTDALACRAAFPLRVTLHADAPGPWPDPVKFRVTPGEPFRLVGDAVVTATGNGPATATLTVEGPVAAGGARVELSAALADPPAWAADPGPARADVEVPSPPPERTTVTVKGIADGPVRARWIDLARGIGAFDVSFRVTVEGPLPPDARLAVQLPARVKAARFEPAVLRPGEQIVRASVEAELAADQGESFALPLIPPAARGGYRMEDPPAFGFRVAAPPPAQLALAVAADQPGVIELTAPGGAGEVLVTFTPVLTGLDDPAAVPADCQARVSPSGQFAWDGLDQPLPVGVPATARVRLPHGGGFFFDAVFEAELDTTPSVPAAGVVGSRQVVRVRVEAPFKRVLFLATAALAAGAAGYAVWTQLGRARDRRPPSRPAGVVR